jgi:hypothetical protein
MERSARRTFSSATASGRRRAFFDLTCCCGFMTGHALAGAETPDESDAHLARTT